MFAHDPLFRFGFGQLEKEKKLGHPWDSSFTHLCLCSCLSAAVTHFPMNC